MTENLLFLLNTFWMWSMRAIFWDNIWSVSAYFQITEMWMYYIQIAKVWLICVHFSQPNHWPEILMDDLMCPKG